MNISISTKRIFLGLVLLFSALLLASFKIGFAQDQNGSASGLQISPTRTELNVKRGSSQNVSITLKNVTGGEIIAKPEIDDFVSDNNTGTPKIITDQSQKSPYTIKDFISTISDIPMKSGESKKLNIPVNVPADQPPGAYFGVIRFIAQPVSSGKDNNSGKQVTLTASLGHIVLVNVPGNVKEQLQLISFEAEKGGKSGSIFSSSPDSLALGLKNTGNSFAKPFGTVTIKDFKGNEVYKYEVNNTDPRGNVLPDSTRIFHDSLKNIGSSPGRYSAVASISYGTGGDVLVSEIHFWVIPNWLRLLALLVVILILTAIFFVYKRLRGQEEKYKSRK
ncbi:MAG TPA: DUF916 domain-containing protein [Candidatus Saccharimonadales bacterium]|nr:DUF916 domain-containing protein [Candidatus Saccharimonadales bacterium]